MARKKKQKKKRKKRTAQKQSAAQKVSPDEQRAAPPVEPAPAVAAAPASPTVDAREPVEDLDAVLDEGDSSDSYESLVALVAGLPDDAPESASAGHRRDRAADVAPADDIAEVLDLDDDESTEAVDRLIANALVGAPPAEEELEPEAPPIDLDADMPTPARGGIPVPGAGASASAEAARLAAVVARGAIDETDVPAISLDLGEVSTPEARARLLAEALAHAEHKEARYRIPMDTGTTRRWKALVATAIFVLAAWVAVAPPAWVRPEPPAQLNAAARARSIRTALLLQAQQVEAFRARTQRLPSRLEELRVTLPGVRYARSGNRAYQLVGYEPDGNAIVYDSTNPSAGFRVLMSAWLLPEGTP